MVANNLRRALQSLSDGSSFTLSIPKDNTHGDYSTNLAMQLAGATKRNPREVAEELVARLNADTTLKTEIDRIEIAGPGFINFFQSEEQVKDLLKQSISNQFTFNIEDENKGKKVIVEYSSPNIAKPFTIGHLRSTIIGDAIANLLTATGLTVYRDNHLGDWGTQFGKQIYAIKTWGNVQEIEISANPVKELVSLYVKFHEEAEKDPTLEERAREWFKKLEDGDSEARELWKKCIDWSWVEFSKIYSDLNVVFTENNGRGYGESFFEDKMQVVVDELKENGFLKNGEEGAMIVEFEDNKYPPLMILKKDGATLYSTRDLAADKWRLAQYGRDTRIVNEVGSEQSLYFSQLFELEKMLGWVTEGQRVHLKHGLFRFADKKMSTRKGNVIWLEDVLSQAHEKAVAISKGDTAQDPESIKKIAVGALKWNELMRDPIGDVVFDWDEVLNMKGNSGPYMQYTVARLGSLIETSEYKDYQAMDFVGSEHILARKVTKFSEYVINAAHHFQTSTLCEYLFELAQDFNTLYDTTHFIGHEREESLITLSVSVRNTLQQGLSLLGISIPTKM